VQAYLVLVQAAVNNCASMNNHSDGQCNSKKYSIWSCSATCDHKLCRHQNHSDGQYSKVITTFGHPLKHVTINCFLIFFVHSPRHSHFPAKY